MQILNSTIEDIDAIFELYDAAISFQKTKFNKHWQGFERSLVETEIKENRQWKIVIDGNIACIFAVTYEDVLIWGEKSNDFVIHIIHWAKEFCKYNNKQFIRMDTWGDNDALIQHYTKCGFSFLGLTTLQKSEGLPKHYEGACLSLFEIEIVDSQQTISR